jgi:glyoxylase-like metal-dependent hydrolase (beta-lactamase superfamily II)
MGNFAYLFGCQKTKEAALVDPGFDVEALLAQARADGYRIAHLFTTHGHYDHVGGHKEVAAATGARIIAHRLEVQTLKAQGITVDLAVEDGETVSVGDLAVQIIHTPGHTPGAVCLLVGGEKLITGDTLFVGDCGRVDLPGGSLEDLFESIQKKLKTLPEHVQVYPGHDYGQRPFSTIGDEKRSNPAMACRSLDAFRALP